MKIPMIAFISVLAFTMLTVSMFLPVGVLAAVTYSEKDSRMIISNDSYEIAFDSTNGSVRQIVDKTSNKVISDNPTDGRLFWLDVGAIKVSSSVYKEGFSSSWDQSAQELTLTYKGLVKSRPNVEIKFTFSDDSLIRISATIDNTSANPITYFSIPGDLRFSSENIKSALLPMLPGVKLNSGFFADGKAYKGLYPGIMFADYLALDSANGKICVYSMKSDILQPVLLGFENAGSKPRTSRMVRSYQTWIDKGAKWSPPVMVMSIGEEYTKTIARYRKDKGISVYKTIDEKLGSKTQKYFESPMYKFDMRKLNMTFPELKYAVIDKLAIPGIVHLAAFQKDGHDESYPSFIPPDPDWGTVKEMADFVKYSKDKGNLVVPYTNFSWWDSNGSVITDLKNYGLTLQDIAIRSKEGAVKEEFYGDKGGYVVNQFHPFVESTVREQHTALIDTVGVDGILEDQWGARPAPLDFNTTGLQDGLDPSTQYYMGVMKHHKEFAGDKLMTECGVDVLADDEVGFTGTNYLWDMLGYREQTAPYSDYYPMMGMLLRDKVLLYQHDLAPESWTTNKSMLRWNMAMGYNLSSQIGYPWVTLIGVFQKYLLSRYADRLVLDYKNINDTVKVTDFGDYKVYSNWDDYFPYERSGYTVAPGGVMAESSDGSVIGGVFTSYNGHSLDPGEHYIVQIKSSDGLRIYHPGGPETNICIPLSELNSASQGDHSEIKVRAFKYDGTLIGSVKHQIVGNAVKFRWLGTVASKGVGFYEID